MVIDLATNTPTATILVGDGPVAIATRAGRAYVTATNTDSVSVVDLCIPA